MNRKLSNSLSALTATGAVLVATVVFGLAPLSTDRSMDPTLTAVDGGGTSHLIRTLAMPYFSFVPRG